ncbi:MAG: response regulator [Anaerolineae bacterium]|nr:response regulator [Anaerolineae bacterium]
MPINHELDAASHRKIDFFERLREALYALYDPVVIGDSPLNEWLRLDQNSAPLVLRQALLDAITALKPQDSDPRNSKSWRIYNVLHQRFVGQWSQRKVALNLALSERQLQREEKAAIKALMSYLWSTYHVDQAWQGDGSLSLDDAHALEQQPHDLSEAAAQELRLAASLVETDIAVVLDGVLATLKSALERSKVQVDNHIDAGAYRLLTYGELLRQAVLNVLFQLLGHDEGGTILLDVERLTGAVLLHMQRNRLTEPEALDNERFAPIRALVQVLDGELIVGSGWADNAYSQRVTIRLADITKIPVLFVDDNADTLRLYQHHLAHSSYQFIGCNAPLQSLNMAKENAVHCIVLDVLMPELDGWRALEILRHDPITESIPIIVTSILPQAELALALGAVEFMRKPIPQSALLAALSRWHRPSQKESA